MSILASWVAAASQHARAARRARAAHPRPHTAAHTPAPLPTRPMLSYCPPTAPSCQKQLLQGPPALGCQPGEPHLFSESTGTLKRGTATSEAGGDALLMLGALPPWALSSAMAAGCCCTPWGRRGAAGTERGGRAPAVRQQYQPGTRCGWASQGLELPLCCAMRSYQ